MWYLAYFMHRHLDFRLDELQSLAVLAGVQPAQHDDVELRPPASSALSEGERGGEKGNEGEELVEEVSGDEGSEETRRGEGGSEMKGEEEDEISGGGGSQWEPPVALPPFSHPLYFPPHLNSHSHHPPVLSPSFSTLPPPWPAYKGDIRHMAEAPTYEELKPQVEANIATKISPFTALGSMFEIVVDVIPTPTLFLSPYPLSLSLPSFSLRFLSFSLRFLSFSLRFLSFSLRFLSFSLRFLSFSLRFLSFSLRFLSFSLRFLSFSLRFLSFSLRFLSFSLRFLSFSLRFLSFSLRFLSFSLRFLSFSLRFLSFSLRFLSFSLRFSLSLSVSSLSLSVSSLSLSVSSLSLSVSSLSLSVSSLSLSVSSLSLSVSSLSLSVSSLSLSVSSLSLSVSSLSLSVSSLSLSVSSLSLSVSSLSLSLPSFSLRFLSFSLRFLSFSLRFLSFSLRFLSFSLRFLSFSLRFLSFSLRFLSFSLPTLFLSPFPLFLSPFPLFLSPFPLFLSPYPLSLSVSSLSLSVSSLSLSVSSLSPHSYPTPQVCSLRGCSTYGQKRRLYEALEPQVEANLTGKAVPLAGPGSTFKMVVDGFGKILTLFCSPPPPPSIPSGLLIKGIFDIWAEAPTYEALKPQVQANLTAEGIVDIWAEAPTYEALKPQVDASLTSKVTPFTAPGPHSRRLLMALARSSPRSPPPHTPATLPGLLIKGIFDIWAEAPTYEALKPQVEANLESKVVPFVGPGSTFKMVVDGFGKIFSMDEQRERMERFTYIPFQGKVKLSAPDYKFWVIEQAAECTNNGLPPNMPLRVFIGREVRVGEERWQYQTAQWPPSTSALAGPAVPGPSHPTLLSHTTRFPPSSHIPPIHPLDAELALLSCCLLPSPCTDSLPFIHCPSFLPLPPHPQVAVSDRTVATKYELSRRRYLGPTAMDAELSLLMANQALARRGALMYDPFVGTGSILVAAAHFGAVTLGADIDIRVVRDGKGPNRDVWGNFHQYSLQPPVGLLRADNNCPPWRQDLREMFHAIICDPPYGVRAGGRKSGGRKILNGVTDPYSIADNLKAAHIPSTAPYSLEECLHDLLDTAARLLVIGGRLVYFYPAAREEYVPEEIPGHPCLKLVANSEQILTKRWSRRLVTMVKVAPYSDDMAAAHIPEYSDQSDIAFIAPGLGARS
ncbi:unnamed protein product [Closterium sp. Yama58-4]|nr:unnamed protein product [Closterium sp. Yama58-4]